jgi:hypothetical protein
MTRRIELLDPKRVGELWPQIEPLIKRVSDSSSHAPDPLDIEGVWVAATNGVCHVLAFYEGDELAMVLAFEFGRTKGARTATILAVAGRDLSAFKVAFWPSILAWFKENGAKYVDAYAEPRLARIYLRKFGFTETCSYVRMAL